jgi:hypothetical protein
MKTIEDLPLSECARRVVALTASAWQVAPLSAHAAARRAPRGYVPLRVARRMRAAITVTAFAHSW